MKTFLKLSVFALIAFGLNAAYADRDEGVPGEPAHDAVPYSSCEAGQLGTVVYDGDGSWHVECSWSGDERRPDTTPAAGPASSGPTSCPNGYMAVPHYDRHGHYLGMVCEKVSNH